jgi:hypothetical protein
MRPAGWAAAPGEKQQPRLVALRYVERLMRVAEKTGANRGGIRKRIVFDLQGKRVKAGRLENR